MAKQTIDIVFDKKSIAKLKAIAKHAGALADELEEIENSEECPKCGDIMETKRYFADNKLISVSAQCNSCGMALGCDLSNGE